MELGRRDFLKDLALGGPFFTPQEGKKAMAGVIMVKSRDLAETIGKDLLNR